MRASSFDKNEVFLVLHFGIYLLDVVLVPRRDGISSDSRIGTGQIDC